MTRVVLDEHDADTLLRALYKGCRPARVHTLMCACGATADLRVSPCALDGWRVLPHPVCPACLAKPRATLVYAPSPERAQRIFARSMQRFGVGKDG